MVETLDSEGNENRDRGLRLRGLRRHQWWMSLGVATVYFEQEDINGRGWVWRRTDEQYRYDFYVEAGMTSCPPLFG